MRRRILHDFAMDAAGLAVALSMFALAAVTWRGSAWLGRANVERPERTLGANEANGDTVSDETNLDSALIDASAHSVEDAAPAKPRAFNVLLITIDTLRADIGYAGYPRPVSPNIDALAARSVVYERAYSLASFTPKSLGPMLIGRYSSETYRDYEHYTKFHPPNVFLAERVRDAGGQTVGGASHRYFGWKKGFEQGFDVWDTSSIPPNSIDNDPTITSDRLTDAAIALLSSKEARDIPVREGKPGARAPRSGAASERFFAWFHYLDPHLPYVSHEDAPRFATMSDPPKTPRLRAAYDGEVWFTDREVGRLLRHVSEQPWADETAIVLTSDHGEAFGERGHWGHGRELWEPLVHVPLLVFVPGMPPRRIATKRSHIDIVPTILELMGLEPDADLPGKSLLDDLRAAPTEIEERDVYIDMPEGPFNEMRYAVITGETPGLKLIDFGGRYELFDLGVDPHETKSIASSEPEKLRTAKAALERVRKSLRVRPTTKW